MERESEADRFVFQSIGTIPNQRNSFVLSPNSFPSGEKQIEIPLIIFYPFLNFKLEFYISQILGIFFFI